MRRVMDRSQEDRLKMRSGQALALQANGFASGTVPCPRRERPFTLITVIDQLAAHHNKGTASPVPSFYVAYLQGYQPTDKN